MTEYQRDNREKILYDEMVAKAKAIQVQIDKKFTVLSPEECKEPKVLTEEKNEQKHKLETEKAEIESKITEINVDNSVIK